MGKTERLVGIIEEIAGNNHQRKIKYDTRLIEDLGFDSLKMMQVIVAVEDEFGVDVPIPKLVQVKTVADLGTVVTALCETSIETHERSA